MLPGLPAGSYHLIFYDPYNLRPKDVGEQQLYEQWGLPVAMLENFLFYRLLRQGGVLVQYAVSHGARSATDLLREVAPLYRDLRVSRVQGLRGEAGTSYATRQEAGNLEVPALIK